MRKQKLQLLIQRYKSARESGRLNDASEATMRAWIDELLKIFEWDVQDTQQVLMEHVLGGAQRNRLRNIGSTYSRPDYTLVNGRVPLIFVDAKSLRVNLNTEPAAAFQIRSYGWSINAPYSLITNFEQVAIYDCSVMPSVDDAVTTARLLSLSLDEYVDRYDELEHYLLRQNVLSGENSVMRSQSKALDESFSEMLRDSRRSLAVAIMSQNGSLNTKSLNFYVQTIINRILFIRVCESRGLEREGLLQEFAETDFWMRFRESSYADFYEKYDGPMFHRLPKLHALSINNDVFLTILRALYYPSPYCFDVIPLKTLSDIYDLFLGYQLVVDEHGCVSEHLKTEFQKTNGAVTTPEFLVNQVVVNTIEEERLMLLSAQQIMNLKIVDIACGSGVFLCEAYEYLVKHLEEKINAGEDIENRFYTFIEGKATLNIEGRRWIINNCIFGIDINPEAVEVAKLSLSLKLIDQYNQRNFAAVGIHGSQLLHGIGENIKCGNSLVGSDINMHMPQIIDNVEELEATNAFDWEEAFPEVSRNGGFDYVVGNPPYVEVKNYNVALPCMAEYIKRVYSSARNGKIDLAIPFIERGMQMLNQNGRLGFVVQKRFFKTDYGRGIRKLLTTHRWVNCIYNYSRTDLFAGRITYISLLICDRRSDNNEDVRYINAENAETLMLPSNTLTETPWNLENPQLQMLRVRLQQELGTLKDVCKVKVGLQVLWNDAYQIFVDHIDNGLIYGHSRLASQLVVEQAACRPLICNEHFSPLSRREYSTYAIFPYSVDEQGVVQDISFEDYVNTYPRAGAYLSEYRRTICEAVETLPQKDPHHYREEEHWHLYTRANNHGSIYEKICIPMTAQYTQAAVVMDRHVYCDNANMFFLQLEERDEVHLYALAGIINSTIFNTLARSIANSQQGGYYKFNKQFMNPVPFPQRAFTSVTPDIERIAQISQQIERLNQHIGHGWECRESGLRLALKNLWHELDCICNRLYGNLNQEEISLLYSVTRNDRQIYGQEN